MKKIILMLAPMLLSFIGSNAKETTQTTVENDTTAHETKMLEEVVVKAPLIRREADRIVLNVSANPLSANKNA